MDPDTLEQPPIDLEHVEAGAEQFSAKRLTHAILYLDDLELVGCENRAELVNLYDQAKAALRPFITFELRSRGTIAPRMMWHPCETRFFDCNGKTPRH